jgi:hypothetical protein
MLRSSSSWPDASAGTQREGRGGLGERGLVSPKKILSRAAQPLQGAAGTFTSILVTESRSMSPREP